MDKNGLRASEPLCQGRTLNRGSVAISACISDVLLAEVIAIREAIFRARFHGETKLNGEKGGLDRASSTTQRSPVGKAGLLGGLILRRP